MEPDGWEKRVQRSAEDARRERKLEGAEQRRKPYRREHSAHEAREDDGSKRFDGERAKRARGLDEEGVAGCVGPRGAEVDPVARGAQEQDLVPLPGIRGERERPGRDEESPRGQREGKRGSAGSLQAGRV